MIIKQSESGRDPKKVLVVFCFGKLSYPVNEIIEMMGDQYQINIFDLSSDIISKDENIMSNYTSYISSKINKHYEIKLNNYKDIIFFCDSPVVIPFLNWTHDFAPKFRAAILFSSKCGSSQRYSNEIRKLTYDSASITRPVMMVLSKGYSPGREFVKNISNEIVKSINLESNYKACDIYSKISVFIEESPSENFYTPFFIDADKRGFTYNEKVRLDSPEKNLFKNAYWKAQRLLLRVGGALSTGIKTGLEHGFDSGAMLDYIYRNIPQGKGIPGYFIDKSFLNDTSWQGPRYRGEIVHDYLCKAIKYLKEKNRKVNIVDIAAGHAKYLFDLDNSAFDSIDNVTLRDYDKSNCELINDLIKYRGLTSKIIYEEGNAFSSIELASLPTDRTVAVASGLYENFGNNTLVMESLKGIYNALEEDGVFIYTNMLLPPRHVYMARVMARHHDKKAWVMRRRFQQEMDELVHAAGFTKVSQRVEPSGICTVSLAKKNA